MRKLAYILFFLLLANAFLVFADSSELEIDRVEITRDGETILSTSSSSSSIDVDPGDELVIKVRLENTFDDDSDIRIEDIRVTAVIEDIDDGDDLSDESDKVYVRADSKRTVRLKLIIPDDASSYQDYDLDIYAYGYDDDTDKLHEDDVVIDVDVEREEHELVFERLWINDVYCDRDAGVRIELENVGEEFEEDVELMIISDELGTLFRDRFDLPSVDDDDANVYKKDKQIDVDDLRPGLHAMIVRVEYDEGDKVLQKTLDFRVEDCDSTPGDTIVDDRTDRATDRYNNLKRDLSFLYDGDDEEVEVVMPPAIVAGGPTVPTPPPRESAFSTVVLALACIAIIAFIVLLVLSLRES
ncbi:hypothetical protein KY349_01540 [Candidatus Woesearchaeota archaeon]|nr:hypothetical protein [Candidatus Woesearchaeota archaeon]